MPLPTDSIADFLTKLRNASRARGEVVTDRYSKLKETVANIMVQKGFIKEAAVNREQKYPLLVMTLDHTRDALSIKRISKPGQRIYIPAQNVKKIRSGLGIGLYSTSKGVLTDSEARKAKVGGEYICEIY